MAHSGYMAESAPKNGEYQDGKLWFSRKAGVVTIGLTNAAIEEIGQVQGIDFPEDGDDFEKGDVVVTLEGANSGFEVTTPVTGVVTEVNSAVREDPDRITEDPTEEGWLVKIEAQDLTDLKEFL